MTTETISEDGVGQSAFRSLVYEEGFVLPAPISDMHRKMLWNAIRISKGSGFAFTQAAVVYSCSNGNDGSEVYQSSLDEAKQALRDVIADRLFVPHINLQQTRMLGASNVETSYAVQTAQMTVSRLGIQIIAESARRSSTDESLHPLIRAKGDRIYKSCLDRIIDRLSYIPAPEFLLANNKPLVMSIQNTNKVSD